MLKSIISFFKTMFHIVKKEDILTTLDNILTSTNNEVIPVLDLMIDASDTSDVIKHSDIISNIGRIAEFKSVNNKDILVKIKTVMVNITKASKSLESLIKKEIDNVITDKTATAKNVAIQRVVSDIGAMNAFIMDVFYLVLLDNKHTDTGLPRIKLKEINSNIVSFAEYLRVYGDNFNKLVSDLAKVSDSGINGDDDKFNMLSSLVNSTGKRVTLPLSTGFVGNPIYHYRMWLVDKDIAKYEMLKDKKRLIELKLIDIKYKQDGSDNASIQKQIEYYEDKIGKLEYQIKEIENS